MYNKCPPFCVQATRQRFTTYDIQSTHGDVGSDIELRAIHVTGQPAYQNVSIPVEHSSELLQDFEMETWCQHLAVGSPLRACKIHDWQVMVYVKRKTGGSHLRALC